MSAMWRRAAPRCLGAGGTVGALWLFFGPSADPDGPAGRPSRDVDAGLRYVRDEGCGRRMSHAGVRLLDGRSAMSSEKLSLAKQGIQLADIETKVSAETFFSNPAEVRKTYYRQVCDIIQKVTGADRVLAFHHHVRHQRAENQLGANGAEDMLAGYDYRVHCDYTAESASQVFEWQLKGLSAEEAATYRQGRFLLINAWRNLSKHPVQNDHLAVCDASSVLESHLLVEGRPSRAKQELTSENFAELVAGPTARYEATLSS